MAYQRTVYDKLRLHVGGTTMTYFTIDLLLRSAYVPALFLVVLLFMFMRFEKELL